MNTTINYYTVQTEEDKEFLVQKKLRSLFQNSEIVIPTEEKIMSINGKKFSYSSRIIPDYVFVGKEDLNKNEVKKIEMVKGVIQIISETTNNGLVPSTLEKDEVSRFILRPNKKAAEILDSIKNFEFINIIAGQYAGYSATIKSITEDNDIMVSINIPSKPKVKVPVWNIGYELEKVGA